MDGIGAIHQLNGTGERERKREKDQGGTVTRPGTAAVRAVSVGAVSVRAVSVGAVSVRAVSVRATTATAATAEKEKVGRALHPRSAVCRRFRRGDSRRI